MLNADFECIQPCEDDYAGGHELVAEALEGSDVAFARLHALYSRRLYRTILAITKDPSDAEDALQETFLRAHLALDTFQGRSSVYTWLNRIAINSALMILRRRRARPEVLFDPQPETTSEATTIQVEDSSPSPENIYSEKQRLTLLRCAIESLSAELRAPLLMQMQGGTSMKDISNSLQLSVSATKTRLHRARLKVHAFLLDLEGRIQKTSPCSRHSVRRLPARRKFESVSVSGGPRRLHV